MCSPLDLHSPCFLIVFEAIRQGRTKCGVSKHKFICISITCLLWSCVDPLRQIAFHLLPSFVCHAMIKDQGAAKLRRAKEMAPHRYKLRLARRTFP
jgi:hypothetical protein